MPRSKKLSFQTQLLQKNEWLVISAFVALRPLQLGKRTRSEAANDKAGESPTKKQKINPESQLPKTP
jgi:hypothetical protein